MKNIGTKLALFATIACSFSTLASCGGGSVGYDPENFLANGTAENPYQIVKDPITIKVFAPHSAGNPEYKDLKMFKHLTKVTGINFDFTTPDSSAYNNIRAGIWSSKNIPDLFLFNNPVSELVQYMELGYDVYVPLNDDSYVNKGTGVEIGNIIDNYMPTYKALLDQNFGVDQNKEDAKKVATLSNGKMYSTLSVKDVARDMTYKMFINQKWIDNINENYGGYNGKLLPNAEDIHTIEEYYTVLKAFKELDANDNGNPDDEIPVTSTSMKYLKNFILAAYGYVSPGIEINSAKDSYVFVPYEEAYRKYLNFANKLWTEGLMHNATFSMTTDGQMYQYGSKDQLGSFVSAAAYLTVGYDIEANYTCFGPLTSDYYKGPALHWGFGSFKPDGAVITTQSPYTREIARLLDIMYSDLGCQLISYGVEGEDWTWNDDTKTSWTFHVPSSWTGNQEQYRATITPNVGSASALYWKNDFVGKMKDDILENLNEMSETYVPYLKVPEPQEVKMTSAEYEKITKIKASLDPRLEYLEASFIRGEMDPNKDSDYNAFITELKGYHADELLASYNDALNRYLGK
jgi:hypothetical protein